MESRLDTAELTRLRMVLGRVGRVLRQQTADDLTFPRISLLFSVERAQPATAGELAGEEGISPPAVTRSLNELARAGLVHREPDRYDGRLQRISLTDSGEDECGRLRRSRDAWLSEQITRLDAADLRALVAALPALERLCDPELPSSRG